MRSGAVSRALRAASAEKHVRTSLAMLRGMPPYQVVRVLEAPAEQVAFDVFNAGGDVNNFTKRMIQLRRDHPLFRRRNFFKGVTVGDRSIVGAGNPAGTATFGPGFGLSIPQVS